MYFDSSVQEGYKNIHLDGYHLLKTDHPSNSKCGCVCIFYKETPAVHIANLLSFGEWIISEVSTQNS